MQLQQDRVRNGLFDGVIGMWRASRLSDDTYGELSIICNEFFLLSDLMLSNDRARRQSCKKAIDDAVDDG